MSDPFVAEIRMFGGNFAPTGWALCNGQLLPLSQNTALFSLVGTYYGGDGKSTFALPNLQGSTPVGKGQGPGLSDYFLGQTGGSAAVTLSEAEMPAHTHNLRGNFNTADVNDPGPQRSLARSNPGQIYVPAAPPVPLTNLSPHTVSAYGGGQPHNNMQPYLTVTFMIALQGVFPPRS